MCGFIGANYDIDINKSILNHRGPDYFGKYKDDRITLFHNRLAILDLSEKANQPFYYKDLILVYNGEIYNFQEIKKELKEYTFYTASDSEVLLYAYDKWGQECLKKLNGDFAFCIYNRYTKKLFCARDRVGNKPFYYYLKDDKFIFSSEIKAFKNYVDFEFNTQKLGDSILFSINDNEEDTIYKYIYNLEPASYLEYDLLTYTLSINKYWKLERQDKNEEFNLQEFESKIDEFEELFDNAVKLRLISDVKIGSMLSGGIDSSIVAYFINKYNKEIDFYSIVFDSFKDIDESEYIRIMENYFNLKVNYLKPTFNDLKSDIANLIKTQDDIFRSLSIYIQYYLFKNANVKVMLSGQGADELFGGYSQHISRYIVNNRAEFVKRIKIYGSQTLDEMKMGLKLNLPQDIKRDLLICDNEINLQKIQEVLEEYRPNYDLLCKKLDKNFSNSLIQDTVKYNLPMLLRFEDRNAMKFSIENRTPFTDYNVIEFAHSLPDNYKFRDGYSKYFLREFANRHLPKEISYRIDKKGFEAPEEEWINKLGKGNNIFDFRLNLFKEINSD